MMCILCVFVVISLKLFTLQSLVSTPLVPILALFYYNHAIPSFSISPFCYTSNYNTINPLL